MAWLAVGAILVASIVPETRLVVLVGLVLAMASARHFQVEPRPIAAVTPTAVYLAWQSMAAPSVAGLELCGQFLSAPVVWTVGGAVAVFVTVLVLKWLLRSPAATVGLVRPSLKTLAFSLAAGFAVAFASVVLGPALAGPFFGMVELRFSDPAAIAPALAFAFASASMQEVAYRGAMLGWLTPDLGPRGALVAQAVAFGVGHTGPDFVASPIPVILVVAVGGAIAGLIVQRYRSLTFPTIVHAAFDIPLYYVAACRLV